MSSVTGEIRWCTSRIGEVTRFGADAAASVWVGPCADAMPALAPAGTDAREALARAPADRITFLGRRERLRQFLGRSLGVRPRDVVVAADRDGVPRLVAPSAHLFVSSASREGWLALAVGASPLGVDLEVVAAPAEPAWNVLSMPERMHLGDMPPADRWAAFLRIWTGKEAYLKAIGLGLSREPTEITIGSRPDGRLSVTDRDVTVAAVAQARSFVIGTATLDVACVALPNER